LCLKKRNTDSKTQKKILHTPLCHMRFTVPCGIAIVWRLSVCLSVCDVDDSWSHTLS